MGFAPLRTESFQLGVAAAPDDIAADSGSDDVGPVPLGSDTSTSPLAWQRHDLEQMLLASRKLGVPMIIGSSGDTGANSRVDLYVGIIKDLVAQPSSRRVNRERAPAPRSKVLFPPRAGAWRFRLARNDGAANRLLDYPVCLQQDRLGYCYSQRLG